VTGVPTAGEVRERLERVRADIADSLEAVEVVAVTKARPAAVVTVARSAGLIDLGENYAQELVAKAAAPEAGPDGGPAPVRWHAIGRLQRNKVRLLAPVVHLWQSIDRDALLGEIAKRAPGASVLIQVNVSGEDQKGGCHPGATAELVARGVELGLDVQGLMAVATPGGGTTAAGEFALLRRQVDELGLAVCSMGMSGDYREALGEGSTMLRLGTVLFGERGNAPPRSA
jgi:pyridoxal phosphate enzyme (YggS family)